MLCDIRFKVPYIGELIRDTDCPAVEDYNDFAEALEGIWQKDGMLLTYAAVLEAEKPETSGKRLCRCSAAATAAPFPDAHKPGVQVRSTASSGTVLRQQPHL